MCICPNPSRRKLTDEEEWRRMADNCQMLMNKACHMKQKRLENKKAKNVVKGMNTYEMKVFQFFLFFLYTFTKLWLLFLLGQCQASRLMWLKKANSCTEQHCTHAILDKEIWRSHCLLCLCDIRVPIFKYLLFLKVM